MPLSAAETSVPSWNRGLRIYHIDALKETVIVEERTDLPSRHVAATFHRVSEDDEEVGHQSNTDAQDGAHLSEEKCHGSSETWVMLDCAGN